MTKSPSALLLESAHPFDTACIQVRDLETVTISLVAGREHHKLNSLEITLVELLKNMSLVRVIGGVIQPVT